MVAMLEQRVRVGAEEFAFEVCRKDEDLGGVAIDHFWLDTRKLYGGKGSSKNLAIHQEVMRLYQRCCLTENAFDDPDTRETFLLASLVPHVRTTGSQNVMVDARLADRVRQTQRRRILELDALLQSSQGQRISLEEFFQGSLRALGRPEFDPASVAAYERLCAEVLNEASTQLQREPQSATDQVRRRWQRLAKTIGRRRGHENEKLALDAISYECRAAFHRCYSQLWMVLLPQLREHHALSDASASFLRFWHTEFCFSGYNRLLHGHIVGLHPAGSALIQTDAGRKAIGHWLGAPTMENLPSLLSAILVAIYHYSGRRQDDNSSRRRAGGQLTPRIEVEDLDDDHGETSPRRRPR